MRDVSEQGFLPVVCLPVGQSAEDGRHVEGVAAADDADVDVAEHLAQENGEDVRRQLVRDPLRRL